MKRLIPLLFAGALLAALAGCQEEHKTYSGPEYVMFADTLSVHMIHPDDESFAVPVASTVACGYDRTFGVEIVDRGSNAIEGQHYRLLSNTITIKAFGAYTLKCRLGYEVTGTIHVTVTQAK